MESFSIEENKPTYNQLIRAYSEKHRFYHNQKHIQACLNHLDKTKHLTKKAHQVELALWFHDAIYKPRSKDNELESAKWSQRFLAENQVSKSVQNNVFDLIIVTIHNGQINTDDQKLLVDIDLSILGSPSRIYDEFEENVRKEYKWVPRFIFNLKRKEILMGFLNQDFIFNTSYFIGLYEKQARLNLKKAILNL